MTKFIELTDNKYPNKKFLVNVNKIIHVSDGTVATQFATYVCAEDYETLKKLIKKATGDSNVLCG